VNDNLSSNSNQGLVSWGSKGQFGEMSSNKHPESTISVFRTTGYLNLSKDSKISAEANITSHFGIAHPDLAAWRVIGFASFPHP